MKKLLTILTLVISIGLSARESTDTIKTNTTARKARAESAQGEADKSLKAVRESKAPKLCPEERHIRDSIAQIIHTDTIHPHSIIYKSRQIMANASYVFDKKDDSLIVVFNDKQIYSNMSMRPELTHLTDVTKRVRYSALEDKKMFKLEKVNPDTTNFKYTYVKLKDTLIWNGYIGYKHKFTMKDQFTGTTYTVVLYECPEIKIDPEFAKYYFSELFFLKVPIKLKGGVIKALAEQRINDKPVMRDELLLMRFDDEESWKSVNFETPTDKGYTLMLPDGTKKEKAYTKELVQSLTGKADYPSVPFRQEFDHE